jgi:rhamnosyltransferase
MNVDYSSFPTDRVYAVVVSFRCDLDRLALQFERLLEEVACIVWVDNGSGVDLAQWLKRWPSDRVHPLWLPENLGIGAAQNRGIEWALHQEATHVLLMDHDSVPGPHMVDQLLHALAVHPDAAAAGACYADPRRTQLKTPFFAIRGLRTLWLECIDESRVWEVDHVIASGCLIPAAVLRRVGLMREDFFIDWVDVEWCLRARGTGFKVYGVCAAHLEHRLGDHVTRVFGREIPIHAPWRHYYQSRNLVLMLGSNRVDPWTKLHHVTQQFKRLVVFSTCVPGRWQYLKMWCLGWMHGCSGRLDVAMYPDPKRTR